MNVRTLTTHIGFVGMAVTEHWCNYVWWSIQTLSTRHKKHAPTDNRILQPIFVEHKLPGVSRNHGNAYIRSDGQVPEEQPFRNQWHSATPGRNLYDQMVLREQGMQARGLKRDESECSNTTLGLRRWQHRAPMSMRVRCYAQTKLTPCRGDRLMHDSCHALQHDILAKLRNRHAYCVCDGPLRQRSDRGWCRSFYQHIGILQPVCITGVSQDCGGGNGGGGEMMAGREKGSAGRARIGRE